MADTAGRADLADDGEDDVLGGDVRRQRAVNGDAHVLRFALDQRLRDEHVLDFGRADAVGERPEGAMGGGVTVAADQHGAGQGEALLGAHDVADALPPVERVVVLEPEQPGVLRHVGDLRRARGIRIGLVAIRRRDVVVGDQQCLLGVFDRKARAPQPAERLRAVHLGHDMPVDMEQARAVRLLVDEVLAPELVIEGLRHGERRMASGEWRLYALFAIRHSLFAPVQPHAPEIRHMGRRLSAPLPGRGRGGGAAAARRRGGRARSSSR